MSKVKNVAAKSLSDRKFSQKIVKNKKAYCRKKFSGRLRQCV